MPQLSCALVWPRSLLPWVAAGQLPRRAGHSDPLCDNPKRTVFRMRLNRQCPLGIGLALAAVMAWPQPESQVSANATASVALVLAGGTVVDVSDWGQSARDLQDAVVIVRDGRITDVGSSGAVVIPKDARVIDCTGKFIIPGLVDGFAGMNSQGQANANLYMGVTTVVARSDHEHGLIDYSANPRPHLYLIDTVGSTDNWSLLAKEPQWRGKLKEGARPVELNPEDTSRQLVATTRLGTRVVLLGHNITAANAQWIITRAHQYGLATYGEFVSTPYAVGVEAGVDALPHMNRYDLGVIPDELQRPLVDDPEGPSANTAYDYSQRLPPTDPHLYAYARFLAAHHAALMPTFSLYYVNLPSHRNLWKEPAAAILDPARMFNPSDVLTGEMDYPLPSWSRRLPAMGQRWLEENLRKKAAQDAMRMWLINETIFSAYPHYLAASGAPVQGSMPGISMHTELELLVRLGLSPREALAAATNNYAIQFGWNELGLIAPGRRADILVVDGDPTVNIWNARRISTLIVDGNVVDRDALLRLKR
jgi:Amidohydrolase family